MSEYNDDMFMQLASGSLAMKAMYDSLLAAGFDKDTAISFIVKMINSGAVPQPPVQ